jgi:ubiquinone/menaquinone biosynthesis C-methylase UbiE
VDFARLRLAARRPTLRVGLLATVVLAAGLVSGGCGALKRCAYEGFDRDDWQQPDRVVEALAVAPGQHVADVGAGGGYFTFRLARAVGEGGKVYAVDVDDDMLTHLEKEAAAQGLPQVETLRAAPDDSNLPPGSVDLVFVSNTYHHLPDPPAYFAGLRDRLRPGGRVAIVEYSKSGFPPAHFTEPEKILADLESAGFVRTEDHAFLERQSFQVFAPRPGAR